MLGARKGLLPLAHTHVYLLQFGWVLDDGLGRYWAGVGGPLPVAQFETYLLYHAKLENLHLSVSEALGAPSPDTAAELGLVFGGSAGLGVLASGPASGCAAGRSGRCLVFAFGLVSALLLFESLAGSAPVLTSHLGVTLSLN